MRVLLRDLQTGLFYKAHEVWVESHMEATDFKDPEAVPEQAKLTGKSDLEIFVVDEKGRPVWGQRIMK